MLTRSELPDNPVVLAVHDVDGRKHTVTTERVGGGKIRMTCSCGTSRSQGWCEHQVQLLCLRYDGVVNRNEETEFHFEDIVMGTPLADTADEVDVALTDYARALASFEKRPTGFDGGKISRVAELASDLADAATQLDRALDRFRKRLAAGLSQALDTSARFRTA